MYNDVSGSKTLSINFCFNSSWSKLKKFLQIVRALWSIGYFADKTFKPRGKVSVVIFFCLNKAHLNILSILYLDSSFTSKAVLKKSCIILLIVVGNLNSPFIIDFWESNSFFVKKGCSPTANMYKMAADDQISDNSGMHCFFRHSSGDKNNLSPKYSHFVFDLLE